MPSDLRGRLGRINGCITRARKMIPQLSFQRTHKELARAQKIIKELLSDA